MGFARQGSGECVSENRIYVIQNHYLSTITDTVK